MEKEKPQIIKDVGFDFHWEEEKVWMRDYPVEKMDIQELVWHLDIPFLWSDGGVYNLTSREVIENPDKYAKEYERTMKSDLKYPIDIMENKGHWLILDGLHRLTKAYVLGQTEVSVRKIPRAEIPNIEKT